MNSLRHCMKSLALLMALVMAAASLPINLANAAMVTTEFLRMYDHYKIRYWINRVTNNQTTFFLKDKPSWSSIYFRKSNRSRKFRDREVFSGLT